MAYTDFTFDSLRRGFGVRFRDEVLFAGLAPVSPSPWLLDTLHKAKALGFNSEKSRSERLVTPVLIELSDRNANDFSVISGATLDADPAKGLDGECDFILSFSHTRDFVLAPVFCIAEAKKQDLELGTIQVAAQLLGAACLNEREGIAPAALYGCSTTGVEWRFIRLENNVFAVDENRYLINDLGNLLAVLQFITDAARLATNGLQSGS